MNETITVFRVTSLYGEQTLMSYPPDVAEDVQNDLDDAVTILCCLKCGDLDPVTGGLPQTMPSCPSCGQPLEGVDKVERLDWQGYAAKLEAKGGLSSRCARVVALVSVGYSHSQVADILGLNNQSNVETHVKSYREQLSDAEWLVDHGPQP